MMMVSTRSGVVESYVVCVACMSSLLRSMSWPRGAALMEEAKPLLRLPLRTDYPRWSRVAHGYFYAWHPGCHSERSAKRPGCHSERSAAGAEARNPWRPGREASYHAVPAVVVQSVSN